MNKYLIKKYDILDSTNLFALREFANFPDGTIITAQRQTAGRGRMNRSWLSEGKGLYFTIVLKQAKKTEFYSSFSHLLALSISKVLLKYGLKASIKWPNDVLCSSEKFSGKLGKISGILAQASTDTNGLNGIVLGAGINCTQTEVDFGSLLYPAYSIAMLTKLEFSKDTLLKNVLDIFFEFKPSFEKYGFASIYEEYISNCNFIGKEIKISTSSGKEMVKAVEINKDGTLSVLRSGKLEKIEAADILP